MSADPIQSAIDQLTAHGLVIDGSLDISGTDRRVPVQGDKGRKKSGWYVAREITLNNGKTAIVGAFCNWKDGGDTRKLEIDFTLTDQDCKAIADQQEQFKQQREAERRRAAREAGKRAEAILEKARIEGGSDYLKRKQVRGFFLYYMNDAILVPLRTITGQLVGIQWIYPNGDKKFLTGTAKRGAFHVLGDPDKAGKLIIAEGYATAATIFDALKCDVPVVIAFDAGNLLPVAQAWRKRYPDIEIIIACDDDHGTDGNPGITKGHAAANAVGGTVLMPQFTDESGRTDFNDMQTEQGVPAVRECIEQQLENPPDSPIPQQEAPPGQDVEHEEFDWTSSIQTNKQGAVVANLANTYLYLKNHPAWKGVIAYDEFASRVVCLKPPPFGGEGDRLWTDIDDTRTATWFSMSAGFTAKLADVQKVVEVVAEDNKFHKVRDYLHSIEWDGRPRLKSWLADYLGALPKLTGNENQGELEAHDALKAYLAAVGTKWLIGAVARVMRPPVKVDNVLILEGKQGLGKSTVFNILASDEWFNETQVDLQDKDAKQMLCGKWIIELAEMDSFNKADNTKAKGFFSTKIDTYRPAYGRRMQDIPRQCVFGGTTNQHEYLRDDENRRYWPVLCTKIDRRRLLDDRDQLWAEALHLYEKGIRWWPQSDDKHLFDIEQQKRHVDDPWYEVISEWLDGNPNSTTPDIPRQEVTMTELLGDCLKIEIGRTGERAERIRVGKIMDRLGWVKRQRSNKKERYYYVRGRDAK